MTQFNPSEPPPLPVSSSNPGQSAGSGGGDGGEARVADPGSRRAAWIFGLLSVVCIGIVIFLNQVSGQSSSTEKAAKAAAHTEVVDLADPFTLAAKMVLKLAYAFDAKDKATREMLLSQSQTPGIDPSKRPETERVREAIMQADILGREEGPGAAEKLFKQMEAEFDERPDRLARALDEIEQKRIDQARADMATLRQIYGGQADAVSPEDRERLIVRHAWFGDVAFTFGKPNDDPKRVELLSGGIALIVTLLGVFFVGVVAVVGGVGCFIAMVVLMATGRIRRKFVAPASGGSFGWEILGAFLVTFLLFKAVGSLAIAALGTTTPSGDVQPPAWFGYFAIGGQWLVALAIFFPLLRGVRFSEYRKLVGWTAPKGVFREIVAGIFGYLAGLPLLFGVAMVTVAVNAMYTKMAGEDKAQGNPILELVSKGDGTLIFLLFTLATIWAPIVEETVFRGGMYRALRGFLPMILASIVSAIAFGFMHGYFVLLLGPVITIGFIFALIREWRGSIIGPMAAHALNNATVLGLVFCLFKAMA